MSAIVQPNADLCSRSMSTNRCSWNASSLDEMMTGKVSPAPRKTCFRFSGSWASLRFGVSSVDGFGFSFSLGSSSKRGCQNLVPLPCESLKMVTLLANSQGPELSDSKIQRKSSRSSELLHNWTSSETSVSIRNVWWHSSLSRSVPVLFQLDSELWEKAPLPEHLLAHLCQGQLPYYSKWWHLLMFLP